LPVTLSAEAGPLYGMMLPNLISVSVMPGCWAEAVVAATSESSAVKKRAGANWLDRIMLHPPRRMVDAIFLFFIEVRACSGNGSCVQLLDAHGASRSTQAYAGQIGAS
jgi:hypothetical protein